MEDRLDICPFPPPNCPDLSVDDPFDERIRGHAHGCGELGLALEKHLAGCPTSITEQDFIMWARAGGVPNGELQWALREALLNMNAREIRFAVFDGRASTRQICHLVAQCGAAESPEWSDLIRVLHPTIPVPEVAMNPVREKALMWNSVGDGLVQIY